MTGAPAGGDNRGGRSRGQLPHSIQSPLAPRDVTPRLSPDKEPTIHIIPHALDELLGWSHPDALWITGEAHSDDALTLWILDVDYRYTCWRANRALDGRWTLSPVAGPWENEPQATL